MFKVFLKITFRHLAKRRLNTLINAAGLTAAITACLLIGIYIWNEWRYDRFHQKADRIARVTMEYKTGEAVNSTATTGTKVGPQLQRVFPAVEEFARTYISRAVVKKGGELFEEPALLWADPAFFRIFSFEKIAGDLSHALDDPSGIAISKSMAHRYFGQPEQALQQTLTMRGQDFIVKAVFDDVPQASQLKFNFATRFSNLGNQVKEENWWTANWITYLLLRKGQSVSAFEKQVADYMQTPAIRTEARMEGSNYLTYHLEPLTSVHLQSSLAGFEPNGNRRSIYTFALVALMILLIACANYTNLATAQSAGRSAEIGLRKVLGASGKRVMSQFLGESAVLTFLSGLAAMALACLLIPYFNELTGREFSVFSVLAPIPILLLLIFILIISLAAGIYPALVLAAIPLNRIIRKGISFSGGRSSFSKGLLALQFGISVFLVIYMLTIWRQINYLQQKELGYNKSQILVLPVVAKKTSDFENLKQSLQQVRGVEAVTAVYETPEYVECSDGITVTTEEGKKEISLNAMPVDLEFTRTLQMKLAAGRDFLTADFAMMDTAGNYASYRQPYIINETLAKKIGWTPEEAIGQTIEKGVPGPVVGVVKDFHFNSLHEPIGPLLIFLNRDQAQSFLLRLEAGDMQGTISRLETLWKQRVENRPFSYHFLDEDYNKLYIAEQRSSRLFSMAAGLAILLASLGLFGLAAFATVQRTKEIGIRRILGAGWLQVTTLIAGGFVGWVLLGVILALPLSWWAGSQWLDAFAFRIELSPAIFLLVSLATLLLAVATVAFHSIRSALASPTQSLRNE